MIARMPPVALGALLLILVAGCAPDRQATTPEIRVSHLPPEAQDMIEALLRSESVSLSVHPSCASAGEDQTIGRYIGRLLAEGYDYDNWANRKNWIDVTLAPEQSPSGEVWRGNVVIHAGDGGGGGVEFQVQQSDGLVLRDSFRCLEVTS